MSSPDCSTGDSITFGDKGDGSPQGKAEAQRRHAHLNNGHVPDAIRHSFPPFLYEAKSISPFRLSSSPGTQGGVCTCEGHLVAFGNTEEELRAVVFGVTEQDGPSFRNRSLGVGRVNGRVGAYADALSKHHGVALLHTETTGALALPFVALLRILAGVARRPGTTDSTVYGASRSSTRSFFIHHLASISSAILFFNSVAVQNAAKEISRRIAVGAANGAIDWRISAHLSSGGCGPAPGDGYPDVL